jgi:DNA topoisomerase-1
VEEGRQDWKALMAEFYADFSQEMQDAEAALEGTRLKVPDEVTEEICELCGKNMVIKLGRFGKFLACPGWPECTNTKPIVERMPGRCPKCASTILKRKSKRGFAYYACERGADCGFMTWDVPTAEDCPKCGSTILKRKSKRGFAYYACERGADCGFMTWDVPTAEDCPECGFTLFKKAGKGRMKPFCTNETCSKFLPEDKRGYYKKPAASVEAADAAAEEEAKKAPAKKKTAAKKTAAKKTTAKKTTTRKKKGDA